MTRTASGEIVSGGVESAAADAPTRLVLVPGGGSPIELRDGQRVEVSAAIASALIADPSGFSMMTERETQTQRAPLQRHDFSIVAFSAGAAAIRSLVLHGERFPVGAKRIAESLPIASGADPAPVISAVYPATFESTGTYAPGELIEVLGANLANGTTDLRGWDGVRFPALLNGVSVNTGRHAARILYISPSRILAQVPFEVELGTQMLTVSRDERTSLPSNVDIAASAPSFYRYGEGVIVIRTSDFSMVAETNPARPGERLMALGTGFGVTAPPLVSGQIVRAASHSAPDLDFKSGDGEPSPVKATAGLTGIYQVEFDAPAGDGGSASLRLWQGGGETATAQIFIAKADSVTNASTGDGTRRRDVSTLGPASQEPGALPYFLTSAGDLGSSPLRWSATANSLSIGASAPEGGLHIKNYGAAGRTSISLDTTATGMRRRALRYLTDGVLRWSLDVDSAAEKGLNVGSYFGLNSYFDNGSYARTTFAVRRDNGNTQFLPNDSTAVFSIGDARILSGIRMLVRGQTADLVKLIKDTTVPNLPVDMLTSVAMTTKPGADGFGTQFHFRMQHGASGGERTLSTIRSQRDGADNRAAFTILNAVNGLQRPMFRIGGTGRITIGLGTDNGVDAVQLSGDTRVAGKFYVQTQTPATSASPCLKDQLAYDANHIYVCVSTNMWKRTAISTW